jgi:poly(3-hydroxybutyrate) depolymerase
MTSVRALFCAAATLTAPIVGCSSADSPSAVSMSGGSPSAGSNASGAGNTSAGVGGAAAGRSGSGGVGGSTNGGSTSGGSTSGGSTSGGAAGAAMGGAAGLASGGSGVAGAGGGTSGAGAGGSNTTGPDKSAGCGNPRTLQNGKIDIDFGGASRNYILRTPDNYDSMHAYRLVFAFAESGASAMSVATRDYFTLAALDTSKSTIFVAPDAANGMGSWSKSDVELTDAILERLEADLCIDKTRIFATGFSFGGAMSIAIACTRADVFRGVAFFSGADLTGSCTGTLTKPIAYYASQASGDSSGTPMPSSGRVKQAEFAAVNGCMAEPTATTFPAAGQPHTCTDYKGCSAGHPTKYCVFDGPHGWEPKDPGQSMSWNAPEAWKFIAQF